MNHASYLSDLVADVLKSGHWMIRADTDGVAHGGFEWAGQGEWTEAPDWDPKPVCGGGLHGQTKDFGGFISRGNRLLFCEYDPGDVVTLKDKIKVRRARILLVNDLPEGLSFNGSLDLRGCNLPDGFTIGNVGGSLYLEGCTMPDGTSASGMSKADFLKRF